MAGLDACLGMAAADYPDWLRWRFELTLCYDHAVEAKNRAIATWTDQLAAWLLHAGTVEVHHAGGRITARAGQWVLFPPGLSRRHRFSTDAVIRSIRSSVLDPAGQPPGLGHPPVLIDAADAPELSAASNALFRHLPPEPWRDLQLQPRDWAALQADVLVWTACALDHLGITGSTPSIEPRVVAAQRVLLGRRSPAALPWADLRVATGLSRPQLDRLFRQHCGGSVRTWVEGRLLTDACRALEDQREAVKAVAARLGFGDASHFCRWFRARTGASPQDWRRHTGV